eukprot:CAMPEP_0202353996 /NCGR_PEP_ID=MMETSP1126-20121109/9509_1 /ASSEMBLY_ACC=CAM_ASM_000457 /TAXON_ID=3047 /ORGANISM="Dunaliella tertiolecta, Strain CCMP1320" /LENGTH=50 /DNA_ID=CAMNT_0048946407 /DNA_START=130 /DNA_END=282 /DNA_ORIENTATION=+
MSNWFPTLAIVLVCDLVFPSVTAAKEGTTHKESRPAMASKDKRAMGCKLT